MNSFARLLVLLAGSLLTAAVAADEMNMPVGVTALSREVHGLHMLILYICCGIGVVVFGAMLWSIIYHRKSTGHEPAQFHESTKVEIAWTLVPLLILVGMAVPATRVLVDMYDFGGEDLTVEVRGYQWKWQYKYLDEDLNEQVAFFSNLSTPRSQIDNMADKSETYLLEVDEPLVIPVGKKVRFLLTANDVIHSWWVPDFGMKKDAIPGLVTEMAVTPEVVGTYRGQCTELCGKDHGFMPIVVNVVTQEEYDAWYAGKLGDAVAAAEEIEQDWSAEDLYARGEQVYGTNCVACHQQNGQGMPPVFPAIAGSDVATGDLRRHMDVVVNGKPGTAMAAFGQQLTPVDLAAVLHYQRNAFGNETGDVVTPNDVLAFTSGQ